MCRGINKSNTSWPQPTQAGKPQCGIYARMTSSSKSATTATEYVISPGFTWMPSRDISPQSCGPMSSYSVSSCVHVLVLDALLRAGLEPRSGDSARLGF